MPTRSARQAAAAPASRAALGIRVRRIRAARGWTLAELAARSDLAISTISKVERGAFSLTYDRLVRLAHGLGADLATLLARGAESFAAGTAHRTRQRDLRRHETPVYDYHLHAADLAGKHMTPSAGAIKARAPGPPEEWSSHPGEEFVYVMAGRLEIRFAGKPAVTLDPGESAYFDSVTRHTYVSTGRGDARIVVVCWSPGGEPQAASGPKARRRGKPMRRPL